MQPSSIARRIILALAGVTILSLLPFVLHSYFDLKRSFHAELDAKREVITRQLASSLIFPIYNLDKKEMLHLIANAMVDRNVFAVLVLDVYPPHPIMAAMTRDKDWRPVTTAQHPPDREAMRNAKVISFQERAIGSVEILFSDRFIREALNEAIRDQVIALGLLTLLLSMTIFAILRHTVIKPLRRVERFALAVGKDENAAVSIRGKGFAMELENVKIALEHMVAQLRARLQALQESQAALQEKERRLDYLAHHDPLTDLPNRLLFQDRLRQSMARAKREQTLLALLFLDVDRFKNVNDTLGHDTGDHLLWVVGKRLRDCVRLTDTVARLGGDEFVVILDGLAESGQAVVVARKILDELPRPIAVHGTELQVTISIGISLFPNDAGDAKGLMKCADLAMYQSKEQGRDTYRFFQPEMAKRTREFLTLEKAMRRGLEQEQFLLYYQPQYDLRTDEIIGIEALVRWRHPERGMIPPGDFIPLAEDTGLIVPLGRWVLYEACRQNREWQRRGVVRVPIAVNVSPRQFRRPEWVGNVRHALEETGLDRRYLELEITEGTIMENVAAAKITLNNLRAEGIRLALDDFGSGYSSLAYLREFPLTTLKIDRVFVTNLEQDGKDTAIISTIIALGKGLELDVIAEGIEQLRQKEMLRAKGCGWGQGFLFCPPVAPDDFEKLLGSQAKC